eukprot:scaffold28.g7565.t1
MDKQRRALRDEFERATRRAGRKHLCLADLLTFPHALPVKELTHLGVLSHSGRISLDDLCSLAELLRQRSRLHQSYEREAQLQAWCTLQLWAGVAAAPQAFVDWIAALALECGGERRQFRRFSRMRYVPLDTVQMLHRALRVQQQHGMDLQQFVDLLQRAGEEQQLLDLQDEEQDDWVPLDTVREFAGALHAGAARLMADVLGGGTPADLASLAALQEGG